MSKNFTVSLPGRSGVRITGEDAGSFLQGLITNDIEKLQKSPLIYSCLLSPQGKFQYDFFILKEKNGFFLDCEGGDRAENLAKRLSIFKLRSKVEIEIIEKLDVKAGNTPLPKSAFADPRLSELGWRDYSESLESEDSFDIYDIFRLKYGVPDGSRDLIVDKSTIIESRLEKLNAVSFKKGCYMGQELTARMYYRGLAKKHLYPVETLSKLEKGTEIKTIDGKLAGEIRSSHQDYALALLKDTEIENLDPNVIKPFTCEWMT